MEVRSLGFRTDLMVRRLAGSEIADRDSYLVVRTPDNPTFYWANFVLFSPSVPTDEWLAAFSGAFPHTGHVAIGVDGTDGALPEASRLVESGFELEVSTVLTLGGPPGDPGQTDARCAQLHTDADWAAALELRTRGLAGALVAMAGHHDITDLDATALVIVADPRGPAIDLYRSLGFRDTEHQVQLTIRA